MKNNQKDKTKKIITSALSVGLAMNVLAPIASAEKLIETDKEYIVIYKNSKGKEAVMKTSKKVEGHYDDLKAVAVEAKPSTMKKLENNPNIAVVEENIKFSVTDTNFEIVSSDDAKVEVSEKIEIKTESKAETKASTKSIPAEESQWNLQAVDAPSAWAEGYTGKGVKVAVIDSGIAQHPELDIKGGVSTVSYTNSYHDDNGHGTHVAGTIGAKRDGVGLVGVAPDVDLYAVKAMDENGDGTLIDIIEGIEWAIDNDMDVINMSLGTSAYSTALHNVIKKAYYNEGIVLVGANGNDGVGTPVNYPAKFPEVIAVSAVDRYKNIADFSSTGSETEFSAPGVDVISTYTNGQYARSNGTSMAAPHVAGFVALLKEKHPSMSPAQLREEMKKFAVDLGNKGRDNYFGYGFLDYTPNDEADTVAPGEVSNVRVANLKPNSMGLLWDNPSDEDLSHVNLYVYGQLVGSIPKDTTAITINGLSPNTKYQFTMKTVDTSGNISNGVSFNIVTPAEEDTTPPAEVTGLAVSNVSHNSAKVTFTNPTDPDFAKAKVYVNGGYVGETTTGEFNLMGLSPEQDYQVTVTTVDLKGNESNGAKTQFRTTSAPDVTPPAEVTGLQAVDVTHNSAKVKFTNPKDADFDKAEIYLNGVYVGETVTGEYEFTNLNPDTDYQVFVRTVDKVGNRSNGTGLAFTTQEVPDVTPPGEVSNLLVGNVTHNSAKITFKKPSDSDFAKSNIYVNGELVGSTTDEFFELNNLNAETNYKVTVKTVDFKGNESNGKVAEFTTKEAPDVTPPAEVTNLTVSDVTHNSAKLTFKNPSDKDFAKANVYVNGEFVGETTSATFSLTGLNPETSYNVTVKTVDDKGNESDGATVEFTTKEAPDVTPPAEVTNLRTTEVTHNSAKFAFTNPKDADFDKANVYVNGNLVGSTKNGTFNLDNLKAETKYTVKVTTVDKTGNESEGTVVEFTTKQAPDVTPPAEVSNLAVSNVTHNSAKISFTNPTDKDFAKANIYVNGEFVGSTTDGTFNLIGLTAETDYVVTVKTVDEKGNESEGKSVNVTTKEAPDVDAPDEVTGLKAIDVTHNSAKLVFTNPKDADFEKANVYVNGQLVGSTTDGTFELKDLDPETQYAVVVKTVDDKGNESDGVSLTVTTKEAPDVTPPAEVSNLAVSDVNHNSAKVTFTNPTDADFAKANVYVNGQFVGETTTGSFVLNNLDPQKSYVVTVKTVDENGNESEGKVIEFTTKEAPDVTPPAEVTGLKAINVTHNSAKVTFTNPTDADFAKANVYVNGQLVGSTTNGTFDLTGLASETKYVVTVKTVDENGNESEGKVIEFTTQEAPDVTPPAEVGNLAVSNVTHNSAQLTFTNPIDSDFAKANIYVNGKLVGSTTDGKFTLTNLDPQKSYVVTVKTVDEKGNESEGKKVTVTTKEAPDVTPPAEVTGLKATNVTHNSANISFTNPTDKDFAKANVYVNGQLVGSTTDGKFALTGLKAETSYNVTIKTVDEKGNESDGVTTQFTTKEAPDVTPPAEVTNLKAINVTHNSAELTFANPTDKDFAKANVYVNGQLVGSTTNGKFDLTGLESEKSYVVVVKTVDAKGNESQGQSITVTTKEAPDHTAPGEVTGLRTVEVNETSVRLAWTNPKDKDFAKTNIYVNGYLIGSVSKSTTSIVINGLKPSTAYNFTFKTVDDKGNESTGSSVRVVTKAEVDVTPPAEVANLKAVETTTNSTKLSWTNPTDKDFAKTNIYVNGYLIGSVSKSTTSVIINGLKANTNYDITLKTVDNDGNESVGKSIKVKTQKVDVTPPGEISKLKVSSIDTDNATFSWTNPTDKDFEKINVYVNGYFIGSIPKTTTSVKLNGLSSNSYYQITFKTVDSSGNESRGVSVTFKTKQDTSWLSRFFSFLR